jgi:rhamnose transport system permease protein
MSGGAWVNADQMSQDFIQLQRGAFLGLPILSWFAIVVAGLMSVLMTRTPLGRAFYAIGVNPTASVYTGIDVGRTKFLAFVLSGAISGLCGYLWISRYVIASVEVAGGYELTIVAACVIGGVSIAGGIGTVAGALLGAIFLGVVNNALPVIGVSPFWQMAISGAAILLAVVLNARGEKSKGRVILRSAEGVA